MTHFRLYNEQSSKITENKHFLESAKIDFSEEEKKNALCGLSVSGNIKFKSDLGLVRILLEDNADNEYLVYEAYPLLTEGKDVTFESICEESSLLQSVLPDCLKIVIKNAECNITSIELSEEKHNKIQNREDFTRIKSKIAEEQLIEKINTINRYNEKTKTGWYAGVNDMAKLSFADKKRIFSAENDFNTQGYEYYVSGFFTVKSPNADSANKISTSSSAYIDSFDWRNRHGVNWDTSVKHQGSGGGCWAFAAVAIAESYVNLYYNQKLDLDLSEQDVISCNTGGGTNVHGGWPVYGTNLVTTAGIVDENCFPFVDADVPCSDSCMSPNEKIRINGSSYVSTSVSSFNFEDDLKKKVIAQGPITGTIYITSWRHAMEIAGYGTVKVGDRVRTPQSGYTIIEPGNPLIGKTYWIYKNSYGLSSGNDGYHYIVFENYSDMGTYNSGALRYFTGMVTSLNFTESDRICEDRDGDGYYFWGIGPKPAHCPSCAPDEPDGDDSNPNLGPMDEYGYCEPITPLSENITTSQTWNTNRTLCKNLVIQSGATLTITATAFMQAHKVTIQNGGKIILSGGTIDNGNVIAQSGSELTITNNGKILLGSYDNLDIQLGAIFENAYGEILLKQ
jgi:C1A family cysteine protease